jgi:hypothetical protein
MFLAPHLATEHTEKTPCSDVFKVPYVRKGFLLYKMICVRRV